MQQTPNLSLNKPDGTDVVDIADLNANMDIIDGKLGVTGHNHTGTAGNGPKITSAGLANGAATDTIIGTRTITDTLAAAAAADTPTNLWSKLGYMIKAVTGKSNWYTVPALSLEAINTKFGTVGHSHDGIAGNGPKISAGNIANTALEGLAFTDVQNTLAAVYEMARGREISRNIAVFGPVSNQYVANYIRTRYTDNLCVGSTVTSGGDYTGYAASNVLSNNPSLRWWSSQNIANQSGTAYIGSDFGVPVHIRRVKLVQDYSPTTSVTSIKVQNSANGTSWNDVTTVAVYYGNNIIELPASSSYRYWRILANANLITSNSWVISSIAMYGIIDMGLTVSSVVLQANTVLSFAAGMGDKGPIDHVDKTAADITLELAASGANTIPLGYTDDICNGGATLSSGDNSGYPKTNAFDKSAATVWQSSQTSGHSGVSYLGYDFGSGVTRAVREMGFSQSTTQANAVTSVSTQYSDNGTAWTTASTHVVLAGDNVLFIPYLGTHRYWRVLAGSSLSAVWQVTELTMFEAVQTHYMYADRNKTTGIITLGSALQKPRVAPTSDIYTDNLCVGGVALSGGDRSLSEVKELAFDGTSKMWGAIQTATKVGNSYIAYDFGVARQIRKIVLDQSGNGGVTSVIIKKSNDGVNWTNVSMVSGLLNSKNDIYVPSSGSARYWALFCNGERIDGQSGWNWYVTEITMHEIATELLHFEPTEGKSRWYDGSVWTDVDRIPLGIVNVDSAGKIVNVLPIPYGLSRIRALPAEDINDLVTLGQFELFGTASAGGIKIPVNDSKYPVMIQWVKSVGTNVTFAKEFPNEIFAIVHGYKGSYAVTINAVYYGVRNLTLSGFTLANPATGISGDSEYHWVILGR